jgi:multiple sugar transport system substrate-binding protein
VKTFTRRLMLVIALLFISTVALTPAAAAPRRAEVTELVLPLIGFATELPGWQAAVAEANKILEPKNIRIKTQTVTATTWDEYYQKVTAQLAAGQPLDIGRIAESQMPTVIKKGQALDLTDYIKEFKDEDVYLSTFKNAAYQGDRYFGVPSGVYNMLLYYNKDMFDKAGIAYPSADWENAITMDQVREIAKKLAKGEGATRTFGFAGGPYMAFIGQYAVSAGGANVFNKDGECALTEAESVAAYKWFDGMLREDKTQPRPTDTRVISAWDMFKSGRLAMIVDGTWFFTSAKNDIKSFKVGIAAVPSAKGKAYSSQFVDSWLIWKGTKHEKEAWEAIKAITSVQATKALSLKGVGGIPVVKAVLEDKELDIIGSKFSADDKKAFLDSLNHTLAVPYNEFYAEADTKVNQVMDNWLLGNTSPEDFAKQACDIIGKVKAATK